MDEFNFNQVQLVMNYLDWKWIAIGTPSVGDLRRKSRALLSEVALKPTKKTGSWRHEIFTGGLLVQRWGDSDNFGPWENFSLSFVLEDWRTEEPEDKSVLQNIN